MPLTAHSGVEGESVGLAYALEPRNRAIYRPDGADHERFASLLWPNGDPVRNGTAQDLGYCIGVFGGSSFSQAFSASCSSKPWADVYEGRRNEILDQRAAVKSLTLTQRKIQNLQLAVYTGEATGRNVSLRNGVKWSQKV